MIADICALILIICGVIICLFILGLIFCPGEIIADFRRPEKAGRYTFDRRMWGK